MTSVSTGKWSRRSEGEWRALLSRFATSALSVAAFCERESVSTASFYRWRGLLMSRSGEASTEPATPSRFVDLGILGSLGPTRGSSRVEVTLDLGDGLVVRVVRG